MEQTPSMTTFATSPQKRILCVEDNADTSALLKVLLEQNGYEMVGAGTVAEAFTLARGQGFDLYLIDRWLPDGEGIELCRMIRTFDLNTPIVFLTADVRETTRAQAMAAGAQGYMVKPGEPGELEQIIAALTLRMKSQSGRPPLNYRR
jgi:DNA-binding response OmpR family regulator